MAPVGYSSVSRSHVPPWAAPIGGLHGPPRASSVWQSISCTFDCQGSVANRAAGKVWTRRHRRGQKRAVSRHTIDRRRSRNLDGRGTGRTGAVGRHRRHGRPTARRYCGEPPIVKVASARTLPLASLTSTRHSPVQVAGIVLRLQVRHGEPPISSGMTTSLS